VENIVGRVCRLPSIHVRWRASDASRVFTHISSGHSLLRLDESKLYFDDLEACVDGTHESGHRWQRAWHHQNFHAPKAITITVQHKSLKHKSDAEHEDIDYILLPSSKSRSRRN
jgi:hypothetical protein